MESDIEVILRHHTKTMGMDIELTRAFGSIDMKAAIDQITEEFQKMIAKQKDPVKKEALRKEMLQALKDVRGLRDRLRGTYGASKDLCNKQSICKSNEIFQCSCWHGWSYCF